jgi:transposase-like protein
MAQYNNGYRNTNLKVSSKRKKNEEFFLLMKLINVGFKYIWLLVTIEPKHRQIIQIYISIKRDMLIAEHYISSLINKYDRYPVSTEIVELGIHLKSVSF